MNPGRTTITLLTGLLLSVASISANSAVRMMGAGNVSCTEWAQLRSSNEYFSAGNWMLGFLSSTAWNTGADILANKNTETLFKLVDEYCTKMPQQTIADAAVELANHFLDNTPSQ